MISSKAQHPNCMYMWMNHIISPEAIAAVAEWFGEAPSNARPRAHRGRGPLRHLPRGGDRLLDQRVVLDDTHLDLPGRRDVECVPYTEWVNAWNELRA